MGFSQLPLVLFLISNIKPGHTQERPKPQVVTDHDKVRCEIAGAEDDWTISWFTEGTSHPLSTEREFSINTDVSPSSSSSKITCRGRRNRDGLQSEISDSVTVNLPVLREIGKPLLTVKPEASQILRGETVTLTCDIQGEGWRYKWLCEDGEQISEEKELRITVRDTQTCRCLGCRPSFCSEQSDSVTLTVSETARPILTVQQKVSETVQINRGETVTLTCDIQGEGWRYRWQCGDEQQTPEEKEIRITVNFTQTCRCWGCRQSFCSQWSNEVTLTVSEKPTVIVTPQSSVFTGDSVTLSCDVGQTTGRRIIWYKDHKRIKYGDETHTLRDVKVTDGGKYRCGVEEENKAATQGLTITLTVRVRPRAEVRAAPAGRVWRGQTVTLTCDIQDSDVSSWTYSWSLNDSVIHGSDSQDYRISSVDESHTGQYSCSGQETRGSRHTHTSAGHTLALTESSVSPAVVIGVSSGLICLFLLLLFLILLWCCRLEKEALPVFSEVTYVMTDLKSVNEKQKKQNKGKTSETSDTRLLQTEVGNHVNYTPRMMQTQNTMSYR